VAAPVQGLGKLGFSEAAKRRIADRIGIPLNAGGKGSGRKGPRRKNRKKKISRPRGKTRNSRTGGITDQERAEFWVPTTSTSTTVKRPVIK